MLLSKRRSVYLLTLCYVFIGNRSNCAIPFQATPVVQQCEKDDLSDEVENAPFDEEDDYWEWEYDDSLKVNNSMNLCKRCVFLLCF